MYELKVENRYGKSLTLTNNPSYVITSVEGIDPPDAVINWVRNAGTDGSVYNSAYADNRLITITIAINPGAEHNRHQLYRYFKSKEPVRVYYTTETRELYIDGYVQNFSVGLFQKNQIAQISILCLDPMFKGAKESATNLSQVTPLFEFPFDIDSVGIPFSELGEITETLVNNYGDMETGAIITLSAIGSCANPMIINVDTNEFFKVNDSLTTGDKIIIDTRKKHKSVKKISGGVTTNIIGLVESGSSWLTVAPGGSYFTVEATDLENLMCLFEVDELYEGV